MDPNDAIKSVVEISNTMMRNLRTIAESNCDTCSQLAKDTLSILGDPTYKTKKIEE